MSIEHIRQFGKEVAVPALLVSFSFLVLFVAPFGVLDLPALVSGELIVLFITTILLERVWSNRGLGRRIRVFFLGPIYRKEDRWIRTELKKLLSENDFEELPAHIYRHIYDELMTETLRSQTERIESKISLSSNIFLVSFLLMLVNVFFLVYCVSFAPISKIHPSGLGVNALWMFMLLIISRLSIADWVDSLKELNSIYIDGVRGIGQ